jgi:Ca-activated chloride channel family protein
MTERTNEPLILKASADRPLAWAEGDSVRYIVATVQAPATARKTDALAPPVNLALVIDASGSMAGGKLEHAKRAARGVATCLRDGDRLSLVSFAEDVVVHADAVSLSGETRPALLAAIDALVTRGMTNLSEGWLTGAEKVALATAEGTVNRVILLSDGQANQGMTDPDGLAFHAGELARRGIVTSTVGIGDDYQASVLQAIAEHGGGRLHDAERGEEIVEVLLGELGEIGDATAQNVTLTLSVPATARATLVGSAPVTVGAGSLAVFLGTLLAGRPREVVFKVTLPAGRPDDTLLFGLTARGLDPAGGELSALPAEVSFTFAEGARNTRQPRDVATAMAVVRGWQADILRTAARMNRDGAHRQVRAYVERELRYFERYCQGVPEAREALREVVLLARNADRAWDERTRKEMELTSYLAQNAKLDHRRMPRASWSARPSIARRRCVASSAPG